MKKERKKGKDARGAQARRWAGFDRESVRVWVWVWVWVRAVRCGKSERGVCWVGGSRGAVWDERVRGFSLVHSFVSEGSDGDRPG
eukprot:284675-Rhodomonas_salina.1